MENARLGKPSVRQLVHSRPGQVVLLAAMDQTSAARAESPDSEIRPRLSVFPGTAW